MTDMMRDAALLTAKPATPAQGARPEPATEPSPEARAAR
jgi:hypothetical protein